MDLIDLEDEQIDAEVLDSLAVSMDDFRVSTFEILLHTCGIGIVLLWQLAMSCFFNCKIPFPKHSLLPILNYV